MQRRSSTGSFRASSIRVENRSSTDRLRRSSSLANEVLTDYRKTCKLCSDPINAGTVIMAEGDSWHVNCFVCSKCTTELTDYHQLEGRLVCNQCMTKVVGGCTVCKEYLGTCYVIFNDNKYHTGCLRCSQCALPLGTKEHYTLSEGGHIICDNCTQCNMLSLISNERRVQVRWGDLKTDFSDEFQLRVKEAPKYSFLRTGDVIIAINDRLVSSTNLGGINLDQTVTLTVNPAGMRSRNASDASPPPTTPPSPPPPSSRQHKRRLLKSLSTSPPPLDTHPASYIFKPSQVEVGEVVGQGFFGRVCRARFVETGERICLKELQNVDPSSASLFVDEVALLKNLKHVNVLSFKGIVSNPPSFSLLTEHVEGGTLRNLIKRRNVDIPWSQRLQIALDVSQGMSYLHSKEIIHRDLTSKNCLLRQDGTVVVADFGLAQYQQTSLTNYTYLSPPIAPGKRRSDSVGAIYWRAPEMILDKPYNLKVDVFSYGIVMCELIARIKADPDYLPRKISDWGVDETAYRDLVPSDCPEPFLSVVLQCCCPAPELRPPFSKVCEFLVKFKDSESPQEYNEILFSITRTLHSISEDD